MIRKMINDRKIQKLFVQCLSETSYSDKTMDESLENIEKWEKELEQYAMPDEIKSTLFYVMNSRRENIRILKSHLYPDDEPA